MEVSPKEIYKQLPKVRDVVVAGGATVSHSVVIPFATYSPWRDDQAFMDAYKAIRANTLVDLYRCFELWSLIRQSAAVAGDILEVGVWRGGTGCLMARAAETGGLSKKTILCDTFAGVVKAGVRDTTYRGGEHADTSIDVVMQLARGMALNNIEVLQGIFPDDTAARISDQRFSLCHIDVDVYESAQGVTDWVWPRLSVGGCIVYDDYGFINCDGVTRFVNERVPLPGAVMVHNLNGHAVIVKVSE